MTESNRPEDTLSAGSPGDSPVRRFTMLAPGVVFASRYRIEERLGAGGVGEVYRAFDQLGGLYVALKVLFPRGEESGHALGRLQRELRIVRGLDHPGIVRVHDIGESEGLLYLVMDLLEGETLRARMKRQRLSLDESLRIATEVLEALAVAHDSGVVHRDIKPANIFLTERRATLVDFGLARQADDAQLTATQDFLGTPEYVAPEQVKGSHTVGPAADLYGVGIVLWEMLAGAPPFKGDSAAEVLIAHLQRELPALRAVAPGTPLWICDLLDAMLRKDPERRVRRASAALEWIRKKNKRSARRWMAVLRRRTTLAIALAAIGLGLFLLFPARLVPLLETTHLENPVGWDIGKLRTPFPIRAAIPLGSSDMWSRRYLVTLQAVPGALRAFPFSFAQVNLLTRSVTSVKMTGEWTGSLQDQFPRESDDYFGGRLLRIPGSDRSGVRRFVAILQHQPNEPSAALVINDNMQVEGLIPQSGQFNEAMLLLASPAANAPHLLALAGESLPFGNRPVLMGIELERGANTLHGFVPLPPYDLRMQASPYSAVRYYTCAIGGRAADFSQDGTVATIGIGPLGRYTFDLNTGTPLDGPDKPDDPIRWRKNQSDLWAAFIASNAKRDVGDLEQAARVLELFLGRADLSQTQQGVAAGRAALMWQRAGALEKALAQCEHAVATEPLVIGHWRMLVDLLSRLGRWNEAAQRIAVSPAIIRNTWELHRDFMVGGLVFGDPEKTVPYITTLDPRPSDGSETAANDALLYWLTTGQYQRVVDFVDEFPRQKLKPWMAMYDVIAHLKLGTFETKHVSEMFAMAEAGRGESKVLPLALVRSILARRDGTEAPSADLIAKERREAEELARESIVQVWWNLMAERLRSSQPAAQAR